MHSTDVVRLALHRRIQISIDILHAAWEHLQLLLIEGHHPLLLLNVDHIVGARLGM